MIHINNIQLYALSADEQRVRFFKLRVVVHDKTENTQIIQKNLNAIFTYLIKGFIIV